MSLAPSIAAMFVVALAYGALAPLAPLLAGAHAAAGAPPSGFHTGAVTGTYLLTFAVFAPLWGRLAERRLRNRFAALGLLGLGGSLAAIAFAAPTAFALYFLSGVAGVAAAATAPAVQMGAALLAGTDRKVRFLTTMSAASFAGWFVGPVLVSSVVLSRGLPSSPASSLLVVAVLALVAAAWCVADRPALEAAPADAAIDDTAAGWLFPVLTFAAAFGIGAFEISVILWGQQVLGMDAAFTAWLLLECTLVMAATQATLVLAPKLRPRWNARWAGVLFAGLALTVAANVIWSRNATAIASVAVLAILATVLQAMLAVGTVEAAGTRAGRRIGLQLSLNSAGQGGGSLAAASAFSASGSGFYVAALLLVGAAMLAWFAPGRVPG